MAPVVNEKGEWVDTAAISYDAPAITDFGSIAEHTFDNPGQGDKSSDTTLETDKYGEYSHPATSA